MASVREVIADELRARMPKAWRLIDWQAELDELDGVTIMLSTQRIRRADAAPRGAYDVTVTVTAISPSSDLQLAEAELEDVIGELVPIIEDAFGQGWDEATKTLYAERWLAWDVPVHYIASRAAETPTTPTTPTTPAAPAPLTA